MLKKNDMTKRTAKTLIKEYESLCNEIVQKFKNKHGFSEFDGWPGGHVGTIALFISQYSFNMDDIIFDLQTKQPKWQICKWQDDEVEAAMANGQQPNHINYRSYCMGLRQEHIKN